MIRNTTNGWLELTTGEYAFAENGTWQLANAAESGLDVGVPAIPARDGGTAPAPTGGEFVTVPVQPDTVNRTLHVPWSTASPAVRRRSTRTTPCPTCRRCPGCRTGRWPRSRSEPLWNAVQATLSGAKSPQEALTEAQATAAAVS